MGLFVRASLHQPPSAEWQWIGLVLAAISFGLALMALPNVFQMLWGKPKIEFDFHDEYQEPEMLTCSLGQPFVSKWLGVIGVRRPDARITVTWSIAPVETDKIITLVGLAKVFNYDLEETTHPVLSSSVVSMLHLPIARRDGSKVIACDKDRTLLTPGIYRVDIFVLLGGREHARAIRRFMVMAEGMKWLAA